MPDYRVKKNINWLTRKRDALLKEIAACRPFVDGSVVKVRRKCGNEIYIPAELEEEVREWSREHKRIKAAMREVSKLQKSIIRQHVTEKKLKKGRS